MRVILVAAILLLAIIVGAVSSLGPGRAETLAERSGILLKQLQDERDPKRLAEIHEELKEIQDACDRIILFTDP